MRRKLFNLAAAVSTVLLVATVVLWVRGRWSWRFESVLFDSTSTHERGQRRWAVSNGPFGITVTHLRLPIGTVPPGWKLRSDRSTVMHRDAIAEHDVGE